MPLVKLNLMRILIYSRAFLPSIGGLELNVAHIAAQFVERGHEVAVITTTSGEAGEAFPYSVLRNPGWLEFMRRMRWCEVFHHPNVSLRGLWPLLLMPRPWVVTHHSWYTQSDGRVAWQDRLKQFVLRFAAGSISISQAVADRLETPSVVIGNAYRDSLFREMPGIERTSALVFVGRLVSDKGADILLEALAILAKEGLTPDLSVVGDGPDRKLLESQASRLGLSGRVRFLGLRTGEELVRILNGHRLMVVPSRYNEPFGIVALEGIACGCVVVGSQGGGLKEAIGPCGATFPNGDATALARTLAVLLTDAGALAIYRSHAPGHLAKHTAARVMDRYLEVFRAAVNRSP